MLFVPEAVSQRLISRQLALSAVRDALIAAVDGSSTSFPSVLGFGPDEGHRFSVKSATARGVPLTGLKVGGYWTSNAERGLARHNSLVLLIDEVTGRVGAVVEAGAANAYRTAAADALAVDLLARPEARGLAVFGAGPQARHEVLAIRDVRPDIGHVLVVNRGEKAGQRLVEELRHEGVDAAAASAEAACREADIIVTATAARAPLFDAAWVRAGAHVSSMGSDGRGKQELPPDLLRGARLFADLPSQSVELGEFQHVAAEVKSGALRLTAIGDVARGVAVGRGSPGEITVFDSSGIALQDLHMASRLLEQALAEGSAVEIA